MVNIAFLHGGDSAAHQLANVPVTGPVPPHRTIDPRVPGRAWVAVAFRLRLRIAGAPEPADRRHVSAAIDAQELAMAQTTTDHATIRKWAEARGTAARRE